jgi:DNA-binding protein YbaB
MSERDLSGLRAYAREMTARFDTLREGMGELQRDLQAVAVSAKSPDGYVTATVGARGQLLKLQLDPRIYRRPDSTALATTITETVQRAVADAAEQVRLIGEKHAPGADVGSYLRGDVAKRLERFDFVEDQIAGGTADG